MEKIIKVDGMSCEHCIKKIETAIKEIPSVKDVSVSLDNDTVTVIYDNDVYSIIKNTISDLGYNVNE